MSSRERLGNSPPLQLPGSAVPSLPRCHHRSPSEPSWKQECLYGQILDDVRYTQWLCSEALVELQWFDGYSRHGTVSGRHDLKWISIVELTRNDSDVRYTQWLCISLTWMSLTEPCHPQRSSCTHATGLLRLLARPAGERTTDLRSSVHLNHNSSDNKAATVRVPLKKVIFLVGKVDRERRDWWIH